MFFRRIFVFYCSSSQPVFFLLRLGALFRFMASPIICPAAYPGTSIKYCSASILPDSTSSETLYRSASLMSVFISGRFVPFSYREIVPPVAFTYLPASSWLRLHFIRYFLRFSPNTFSFITHHLPKVILFQIWLTGKFDVLLRFFRDIITAEKCKLYLTYNSCKRIIILSIIWGCIS